MKLYISMTLASAVLRLTVPGPGSYWVLSMDGHRHYTVEASGSVSEPCHVVVPVPRTTEHRFFTARFMPLTSDKP